jgi:hypothetical protein
MKRMVVLDGELKDYVISNCPARIDEALMERFGISYNTLRKIEAGMPIRRSLALRLETRLREEWATGSKTPRKLSPAAGPTAR